MEENKELVLEKDPVALEEQLLKQEAAAFEQGDSLDAALTLFGLYQPKFNQLVDKLSSNGLRRLIKALVAHPLSKKEIKHPSEEENTAFIIGQRVLEAKFVAIMNNYNNHMKAIEESKKESNEEPKEVQETNEKTGS